MTITDKRKKRLLSELKNKEYRDAYVSSSIDVGVAFQIRALRKQREWNQSQLAAEANTQQARISVLENPSHSPTLETLKKLASAFDVGLIVRFVPTSELVKYELTRNSNSLEVPSFNQESFFKENYQDEAASSLLEENYSQMVGSWLVEIPIKPMENKIVDITSYRQRAQYGFSKKPSPIQNKIRGNIDETVIGQSR